jgi:hypothetical protein
MKVTHTELTPGLATLHLADDDRTESVSLTVKASFSYVGATVLETRIAALERARAGIEACITELRQQAIAALGSV